MSQPDPHSGESRRELQPCLFAVVTTHGGHQNVRVGFSYEGDAAIWMNAIQGTQLGAITHLEDRHGRRVTAIAYRGRNYSHASALRPDSDTFWGRFDDPATREKMAKRGWSILDLPEPIHAA